MNILVATSEVAGFAKTGGLADVCGSLPPHLARMGHGVAVAMPAFRTALAAGGPLEAKLAAVSVPIGGKTARGRWLESHLPGSDVPLYLLENTDYFDRPGLYGENGQDYSDNCERFAFFSRALLELPRQLNWPVDILQANDWQTALVPAYLATEAAVRDTEWWRGTRTLMTIHNMAYQGCFWHWDMLLTGMDWKYFNWRQMEFYGKLNLLKTGIVFADAVSTVSRRYAAEIQADLGCGLEGALRQRGDQLVGIVNGVDDDVWNPASDRALPRQYDVRNWREGKAACKAALQAELGLPLAPRIPLVGMIGRIAEQKGWDLILELMQRWCGRQDVQWVILGTGDPKLEQPLSRLAQLHRDQIGLRLEFSDALAHRIEAGADIFLMPSRYEPCGLNQLYSLRYGTVPVVRETGGLVDTITPVSPATLAARTATGFSFDEYNVGALEATLRRARDLYVTEPPSIWQQLVETGMRQDWSWSRSAQEYAALFQRLLAQPRRTP